MILDILHTNLASWAAQVFAIALLGALLPLVFRIRHPRTQLAYCHFVLAACGFLPFIQPWRHAIASSEIANAITNVPEVFVGGVFPRSFRMHWQEITAWILA